jgi:very-short-patch-repair endonuclease
LEIASRQQNLITWSQLLELGLSPDAIRHRVRRGRLHRVRRRVYAVGRPDLDQLGELMADLLCCAPEAVASHLTAAGVLGIRPMPRGPVELSVPAHIHARPPEVRVHRRRTLRAEDIGTFRGIPVTSPVQTLIDIATRLGRDSLEAAINEADKLDLVDPETLRSEVAAHAGQAGVPALRRTLDRRTYTMTDTELERRFLPIARRAGLPKPRTQRWVNGFKVDFWWPELYLVVETDGLRYHRTPAEQAHDRVKDQTHLAAGLSPLRFTRAQVRYEPARVEDVLARLAARLRR